MRPLIVDTSVFIAREAGRPVCELPLGREAAISIVTLAELRLGVVLADEARRRVRMDTLDTVMRDFAALPLDAPVAERFADLVGSLRRDGRRIGVQDAWIAATALANGAVLATQDADFDDLPDLEVLRL